MVIDDNAADARAQPRDAAPHLPVGLRACPADAVAQGRLTGPGRVDERALVHLGLLVPERQRASRWACIHTGNPCEIHEPGIRRLKRDRDDASPAISVRDRACNVPRDGIA